MSSSAYALIRKGSYDADEMPVLPVEVLGDGFMQIVDGPAGTRPVFDEDGEVLSPNAVVPLIEPVIIETVTPIGLGDGEVPDTPGAAPVITQGPNMHIVDMRAYAKPTDWLAFVVEYSTNAGGAWTSLGDVGSNVFAHTNLTLGTAYRYRYSVKDSEGNTGSVSASSSDYTARGVQTADIANLAITTTKIADDAIETPQIAANAVTTNEMAAGSVTAAILASVITISNTFQTAGSNPRVFIDSSGIRGVNSGGTTVTDIATSTGILTAIGAVLKSAAGAGSRVEIDSNGLRFYNASNVLKVELKTSDGSATFTGKMVATDFWTAEIGIVGSSSDIEWRDSFPSGTLRARVGRDSYGTLEIYDSTSVTLSANGGHIDVEDELRIHDALVVDEAVTLDSSQDLTLVAGDVVLQSGSVLTEGLRIGTTQPATATGTGILYKSGNDIMWKAHGQTAVKLNP